MSFEYYVKLSDGTEVRYGEMTNADATRLMAWADDVQSSLRKIQIQMAEKQRSPEWRTRAATAQFAYRRALKEIIDRVKERPAQEIVDAWICQSEQLCQDVRRRPRPVPAPES